MKRSIASSPTHTEILDLMRFAEPNVYALSPFSRPVNVLAQQRRAINFAWALEHQVTSARKDTTVAVVGAGAAGLTAAAYLAKSGFSVSLFEAKRYLVPVFASCIRYLHPRIYDWPQKGFDLSVSDLPLMNWRSGLACDVAESLAGQFQGWALGYKINVHLATHVKQGKATSPSGHFLSIKKPTGRRAAAFFNVVVLAPGFGAEDFSKYSDKNMTSQPWWDLDRHYLSALRTDNLQILGTGDGGLSDLMESVGLSQPMLGSPEWIRVLQNPKVISAARKIDDWIRQTSVPGVSLDTSAELSDMYETKFRKLAADVDDLLKKSIDSFGRAHGRSTPQRTIYNQSDDLITSGAYPLNRFLTSRLRKLININHVNLTKSSLSGSVAIVVRPGPTFRLQPSDPDFARWSSEADPPLHKRPNLQLLNSPAWPTPLAGRVGRQSTLPEGATGFRLMSTFYNPEPQAMAAEHLSREDFRRLYLGRLRRDTLLFGRVTLTDAQVFDGVFFRRHLDDVLDLKPFFAARAAMGATKSSASVQQLFVREPKDLTKGRRMRFWSLDEPTRSNVESGLETLNGRSLSAHESLRRVAPKTSEMNLQVSSLLKDWARMNSAVSELDWVAKTGPYDRASHLTDLGALSLSLRTDKARTLASGILNGREDQVRNAFNQVGLDPVDELIIQNWKQYAYDAANFESYGATIADTIWITPSHDEMFSDPGETNLTLDCIALGALDAKEFRRIAKALTTICAEWRRGRTPWQNVWREWRALGYKREGVSPDGAVGASEWARRCSDWLAPNSQWECWIAPEASYTTRNSPRVLLRERVGGRTIGLTAMAASLWG